jgi:Ca-activated chloride channel family protein
MGETTLRKTISIIGLSVVVALFPTVSSQTMISRGSLPAQDQSEAIQLSSHLVVVPVSVSDSSGRPIRDLAADDFRLEEEGQLQRVIVFGEPGQTPVDLTLLLDVSGSVQARFQFEQQAAIRFLKETLKPHDAVTVFLIGNRPMLAQPRTTHAEQAIASVTAIEPTKQTTAFFDTLVQAARHLGATVNSSSRRVLVVISDGEDTQSHYHTLEDALRKLQQSDCLFYSINPSGPAIRLNKMSLKGQEGMERMASQTGGAAFLSEKIEHLDEVFRRIATELQAQYLLGYYPTDERPNSAFRQITVHLPKRPNLRVRARQGYYSMKP